MHCAFEDRVLPSQPFRIVFFPASQEATMNDAWKLTEEKLEEMHTYLEREVRGVLFAQKAQSKYENKWKLFLEFMQHYYYEGASMETLGRVWDGFEERYATHQI